MSFDATIELLKVIPGGEELLGWFEGPPDFHDAEVLSLHLDRDAESSLTLMVFGRRQNARVTFVLDQWIDVALRGFSDQNVVAGLTLRPPAERLMEPWELGVGARPGEVEIVLTPCFGAYGSIRANLKAIRLEAASA
ncbi:hypothetical protein [Methylopila sp. M107]|uniref:hypothetical protein n=1 Tax=Methylopila sp. M107 TaxID=1101190 RepID=UPI0003741BF8|nr:hypothetical protein [Methylopila sp. M107]